MYGYRYGIDPTYFLVLIGAVICMLASARVNMVYRKYEKVRSLSGMTGAQAAERILRSSGIHDVRIERVSGRLTDHYDPRYKRLCLSETTYGSSSVAAIGVAAHECGHAVQHAERYAPLTVRGALVPVANFGSSAAWIMILLGVFLSWNSFLIHVGIILFSLAVLFQIVTLPVEFNASSRAVRMLEQYGVLQGDEIDSTKKVLGAAALTYVAAAAASILQLLRLLLLFGGRRRDD
jgi:Zn-dependent membrane protease YugP